MEANQKKKAEEKNQKNSKAKNNKIMYACAGALRTYKHA